MGIEGAFSELGRLLNERLSLGLFTTEDTIRYTLYAALTSFGELKHTDLTLEYPHPTISDARIDTVIRPGERREAVAIEFKYDHANPGGKNQPRTQRAASALIDLFRLVRLPKEVATVKYFVYVTDAEMAGYFRNPANRLRELFELPEEVEYLIGPETFRTFSRTLSTMVSSLATDCVVSRVFATELSAGHYLRIFRVAAPPTGTRHTG